MSKADTTGDGFTRHVFLIPGFHPAPPRWHRAQYRREVQRQAQISGYLIEVDSDTDAGWQVRYSGPNGTAGSTVEVLAWDDLVRARLTLGPLPTLAALLHSLAAGMAAGLPVRYARVRPAVLIPALYPYLAVIMTLILGALAGWAVAALIGLGALVTIPLTAAVSVWLLLSRDIAGIRLLGLGYSWFQLSPDAMPPELGARLGEWEDRVRTALAGPADEVLIVGHSAGAFLGQMLASRVLDAGGARLALMGLGSVTPMLSLQPRAAALRLALSRLSDDPELTWVEVGAPPDGMSFGLADPVAVSGLGSRDKPLVLSARFSDTITRDDEDSPQPLVIRHFQYMRAFENPGAYDYFAITAGPQSLARRFAGRRSSPSVIRTPARGRAGGSCPT